MPVIVPRILGIDPGTRMAGYGVVEMRGRGRFAYVECGVIRVPATAQMVERLRIIAGTVEELIEEFRPRALAIEKAYHGRNADSALKLGQARGAIMVTCARSGIAVHEYAPASIKRMVAGHGRATKGDIQHRVALLCELERLPAVDAADALAVALCHAHSVEGIAQ